jgi:ATP:cob(I)alamin adenosyltransferase
MTRTGDEGLTDLWSGERVRKDDLRVEAYGTIDELDSILGEAKHWLKQEECKRIVEEVQRDLFRLAGALATRTGRYVDPIVPGDEARIAGYVEAYETRLGLNGFVIPGSTLQSAKLDVARTVCRRAERRIVSLAWDADVPEPIRRYVNRLSDLLFILARAEEAAEGRIVYAKT